MRILADTHFIVVNLGARHCSVAVVAPTGHMRRLDGTVVRDGSRSPEMGELRFAHEFRSHRAAARCANTLANGVVVARHRWPDGSVAEMGGRHARV